MKKNIILLSIFGFAFGVNAQEQIKPAKQVVLSKQDVKEQNKNIIKIDSSSMMIDQKKTHYKLTPEQKIKRRQEEQIKMIKEESLTH